MSAVLEVKNDWTVDDSVMIAEETTIATHDTDGVTVDRFRTWKESLRDA